MEIRRRARPGGIARTALALLFGLTAIYAQNAAADLRLVNGEVWQRTGSLAKDASKDPGSRPDATFFVTDINFDSRIAKKGDPTLSDFLGTTQFFNQAGDFKPNGRLNEGDGTRFRFSGKIGLKQGQNLFDIEHDDGVVLKVFGLNLQGDFALFSPLDTNVIDSPFAITAPRTGLYDFTLDYGECCTPPAVLIWRVDGVNPIQNPVPEPSSFAVLGVGLLAVGALARKRLQ